MVGHKVCRVTYWINLRWGKNYFNGTWILVEVNWENPDTALNCGKHRQEQVGVKVGSSVSIILGLRNLLDIH